MPKKMTIDEFKEKLNSVHGETYEYDFNTFHGCHSPMKIVCRKHGDFWQKPSKHLQGQGCVKCKKGVISVDDFKSMASAIHGGKYDYSKVFFETFSRAKITIGCPIHGWFEQGAFIHLKRGNGCPRCGDENAREAKIKKFGDFVGDAKFVHGDKYEYSPDGFTGSRGKTNILCPIHGGFTQGVANHLAGNGCPLCAGVMSNAEADILAFVKSLDPYVISRDRETIAPYELDIVSKSKSLAIEVNGTYWHSEKAGRDRLYHRMKREMVEASGMRLISIRSDIWRDKRELVEGIIINAMGASEGRKVDARKCTIKDVSPSESRSFLDKYHVMGGRNASRHFGLFCGIELVSIMSFTKRTGQVELVRFASKCNVRGGLTKMLKHCSSVVGFDKCFSYVDLDLFTGKSYLLAGFKPVSIKPGFAIVNGSRVESRQKWNKAPDGMTQSEWYEHEGVSRIWDSGQMRIEWSK